MLLLRCAGSSVVEHLSYKQVDGGSIPPRRTRKEVMSVLVAVVVVASLAGQVQVDACSTILNSLHADWVATRNLFVRYGPQYEANSVVRALGPDAYFGVLVIGSSLACRNTPGWRVAAVAVWAVQTWAVSTHEPFGTRQSIPLLYFVVK